jgi:hypothetical protein
MEGPPRAGAAEAESPRYAYAPRASIVCPKCGNLRSFPLVEIVQHTLSYAGVCGAGIEPGLWCDAMVHLEVTSHVWPAA